MHSEESMAPFPAPIPILCDLNFVKNKKYLPVDWKQPLSSPERTQFLDQFGLGLADYVKLGIAGPSSPRPYFFNATPNKLHGDAAKAISAPFKDFAHKTLDTFKKAIDMWKLQAEIKGVKIMAVCAIGPPGILKGPEVKGMVPFKTWKGKEDNEKAYIKAVAEGLSAQWKKWQDKVMIPGLPWYPAFAAFPGPTAPPMPNVPMPLIALPSAMMAEMTMPKLKKAMIDALDSGVKKEDSDKQHEALFESIAVPISMAFLMWLPMQMVMNVLGKGPIPTFAPPYVPVGPVVGGSEAMGKGCIAA
jgi:hypothetical protein